jgi:fatty acid synthase
MLSFFLQLAVDSIRQGQCDSAIVAGAHLTLLPNSALPFLRLGMLTADGKCKSFDAGGELGSSFIIIPTSK